uniref:Uncharacterized protein n=1 Tax=Anguilla anguilla TaxID=7936 RepID=A0A0E9TLQ2_ANGAN
MCRQKTKADNRVFQACRPTIIFFSEPAQRCSLLQIYSETCKCEI